jgi:CRP/FNR family cyclic AMP-dependent transcriptional regulator
MPSLLTLLAAQPLRSLAAGDVLITEGSQSGDLYVLEAGTLTVARAGVGIATISQPGAVVGEMSVLLNKPHSATVRAETAAQVRVLTDAGKALDADPALAKQLALLLAARLDATSALLVELSSQNQGRADQGFFDRILAAIHLPPMDADYFPVERHDLFATDPDAGDERA